MRRILEVVLVLVAVGLSGCGQPTQPSTININNTNTNNNGGGLSDPNAVATQCLPSEETPIRVDLSVPDGTVAVKASAPIDSTPKSANGKRSDGCNVLQGIAWITNPTTTCHVKDPSSFNTAVICDAVGLCSLTATVPGKGATGTSSVSCQ